MSDVQLFYQVAIMGRRDLHLAPDPRSGAEMTLLRMLAFRPAAAADGGSASGGGVATPTPTAKVSSPKPRAAKAKKQQAAAPTQSWAEPDWSALVGQLGLTGAVRLLASNCAYLRRESNTVHLGLDPRSESLLTRQRKETLAERLSEHFGEKLTVEIELGAETGETPVQEESRMADERLEAARQTLEADPNVQALKDMFGAELKTDSIELIKPSQSE
jgi:DNA polymerase-3 subunit gamma/tau